MRNTLILIFLLLFTSLNLVASGTNNPSDAIYSDIDRWNSMGLIERLPPIRPYPAQYLIAVLNQVINNGELEEANKAKIYLKEYDHTQLNKILKHNSFSDSDEYQTISGFGIDGNLILNNSISAGLDINAFLLNDVENTITPPNRNTGIEVNEDTSGFSALGVYWNLYQSLSINSAFGNENFWVQTGLMPTSFGPLFSDSVVMNPMAKQAGHFSYTWIADSFTASYLFMPIIATDSTGNTERDDKFIHVRSLDFKLAPWWEFQFYETAIYGGKGVKPLFFLPFSEFFFSASAGGTWDVNSLLGLSSKFYLPQNIDLTGTFYLDDANFNELIKLKLGTKVKMAAQGELAWTPAKSFLKSIKLNYTAILPYMYTHTTEADEDSIYHELFGTDYDIRNYALASQMNYENYTNGGVSMGPYGMDPNSDKVGFNITMSLPKGFTLKYNTEFRRHGNSSKSADREYDPSILDKFDDIEIIIVVEGVNKTALDIFYDTYDKDKNGIIDNSVDIDGSIFDSGYGWTGGYQYQSSNPFLTQDLLELILINDLSVTSPKIDLLNGEIYGELGVTIVNIKNKALVDGLDEDGVFIRFNLNYAF